MEENHSNCLFNLLRQLDVFAVGVGFNVRNNNKAFGTKFGGCVFIIYVLFCLYFLLYNFYHFSNRSIFNQNIMETKSDTAPPINLINSKMAFALTLTVNGSPNDKAPIFDYISFQIKHVSKYKDTGRKEKVNINMTQCSKKLFHNSIDETFDVLALGNYLCIAQNQNLTIRGIFTDDLFQYLELSVNINENGKSKNEFIHQYLIENEVLLQMYYIDSSINGNDYSSPEKLYLNSKFLKLSFPFIEKANAYFSNNTFDNDANIFVSTSSIFNFYTLDNFEQTNEILSMSRLTEQKGDYDLLARLYIRASQTSVLYTRTYQKFTEYLADSTALASQVFLILALILGKINQFRGKQYIIDNILKYKEKYKSKNPTGFSELKRQFKEKPIQRRELQTEIEQPLNGNIQSEINNNPIDENQSESIEQNSIIDNKYPLFTHYLPIDLKSEYNNNKEIQKKKAKSKNKSLLFSFTDMINTLLIALGCGKKNKNLEEKETLFKKGEAIYLYYLDIFTYFTKMREIDLLKYILIPSNKKPIIDFLTKPSISIFSKDTKCPLPQSNTFIDNTLDNVEEIYQSFLNCHEEYRQKENYYNLNIKSRKEYLKSVKEVDKKILDLTAYEIHQLIGEEINAIQNAKK